MPLPLSPNCEINVCMENSCQSVMHFTGIPIVMSFSELRKVRFRVWQEAELESKPRSLVLKVSCAFFFFQHMIQLHRISL